MRLFVYSGNSVVERVKGQGTEVLAGIALSWRVCKFGGIVLGLFIEAHMLRRLRQTKMVNK